MCQQAKPTVTSVSTINRICGKPHLIHACVVVGSLGYLMPWRTQRSSHNVLIYKEFCWSKRVIDINFFFFFFLTVQLLRILPWFLVHLQSILIGWISPFLLKIHKNGYQCSHIITYNFLGITRQSRTVKALLMLKGLHKDPSQSGPSQVTNYMLWKNQCWSESRTLDPDLCWNIGTKMERLIWKAERFLISWMMVERQRGIHPAERKRSCVTTYTLMLLAASSV